MRQQSAIWLDYFMWRCQRHIPTSKVYPSVIARCPTCGQNRPDEASRPPLNPLPPLPEGSPVVRLVPPVVTPPPPAPLVDEAPAPTVEWDDGPEPELDEEPGVGVPDPIKRGIELLDKVLQEEEPETPVKTKRPKDIPVTEKSKAHLCPGPKCRKLPRGNSPYCSKICSDRCLRLRKKALRTALTDEEIKNLNRILTVLDAWNADKG